MLSRTLGIAALSLLVTLAHAGTVAEMASKNLAGGEPTSTTTYAQGGQLRVETKPGDALMIFKDDTIYSVDTKQKSYMALDRAAMKRMAEQMNPAVKQMQEQMAKMAPEQRAQMEKMMGGRVPGLGKEKTQEVRKTSRSDKISAYSCNYVEMLEDGVLASELCVVKPDALKGGQELVDAGMKVSVLFEEMMSQLDAPWLKQMISRQMQSYTSIGGVPVLTRRFEGGIPVNETTLKNIQTQALPAATFEIPAGFTKKEMGPMK